MACDCQTINTVKVQKSLKNIVKIVDLPSMVQSDCYEGMRILFVLKENKNNYIYSTIRLLVAPVWRASGGRKVITLSSVISNTWIRCFLSTLCPTDALKNGATLTTRDREETNCRIIVIIFIFFAYKKYSCHFIKFWLKHWWQMEYFEVFYTFLGLDSVNCLAVNGTVTRLPVFIQNILNCVPKTN